MALSQLAKELEKAQGAGVREEHWVSVPLLIACRAGISLSGCCKRALAFFSLSDLHILQRETLAAAALSPRAFTLTVLPTVSNEGEWGQTLPLFLHGCLKERMHTVAPRCCAAARGHPQGSVSWCCRAFPPLEPVPSNVLGLPV